MVDGERVDVGDRDSEWPEFVFVTASHGTGWVPARHLSATSGTAVVQIAYDTTELPTQAGDVVEVVAEDLTSGWLWCRAMMVMQAGCLSTLSKQPSRLSLTSVHNDAPQGAKRFEMRALIGRYTGDRRSPRRDGANNRTIRTRPAPVLEAATTGLLTMS